MISFCTEFQIFM